MNGTSSRNVFRSTAGCRTPGRNDQGFTLVEMMVVIAILAILATLAMPSFDTMIRNNRLVAETNSFLGDLAYIRGNVPAGKRGVICASTDSSTCSGGTSWTSGRIMFIDDNRDGIRNPSEELLRVSTIKGGGGFKVTASAAGSVCFESNGDGTSSFSIAAGCVRPTLTLCDSRSGNFGRGIAIPSFGPPQVARDVGC